MTPKRASAGPSILAVHPGALGDVILFGHLLSRLGGRVTLAAGGEKARLLAGAGVVARALDFETLPMHEVFGEAPPAGCRLRALLGTHERLISCFGGGDRRAEQRLAAMCCCGEAAFLPVRPPEGFRGHLLDLWSDLLGVPPAAAAEVQPWHIPSAWRKSAREELRRLGLAPRQAYLVVHPGSGSAGKCWRLRNFVELASHLAAPGGLQVLFVLGPVELERWKRETVSRLHRRFPVLLSPPLEVLAGILASGAAYVGNDSGVSHLAAATGATTTLLFGPTRVEHFAPLGRSVRTIAAETIDELAVETVLGQIRALLPEV